MEKVSPTRMNLLSRKSQVLLAGEGVQLLKNKREVLMEEFMKLVKSLMDKKFHLHEELVEAFHCLNTARAVDGRGTIDAASCLRLNPTTVNIIMEKHWGIEIPRITDVEGLEILTREPYSIGTTLRIFETRKRFERVLGQLLELAPLEASLKRVGKEIQKTTRRINALEIMLIPRLRGEIRFIRNTLEEREREDHFRLRRLKNRKGERGHETDRDT